MTMMQTRRRFLSGATVTSAALADAAGILRPTRAWAVEPAMETTTVRLGKMPVICFAVSEALLRAEGVG
jgi:ABC-type nitrate/sulfonate/bicarbonate transport system substrate-binding protein